MKTVRFWPHVSWMFVFGMTFALNAVGQDVKPTVATAPLEIHLKPEAISAKETEALRDDFERLVRATDARVPTPSEMTTALASLKRQDFSSSDEALALLAQRAQTLYALHVQIEFGLAGTVVGVGKVVRTDGNRMTPGVRVERSIQKNNYVKAVTEIITAVLERLELQSLASSLPVATVELVLTPDARVKVAEDPGAPPTTPPLVRYRKRSNLGIAGAVIGIAGAAVALAGVVTLGLASSEAGRLTPDERHYLPAEQVEIYRSAKTKESAGTLMAGVGALAAVGGGLLWLLSEDDGPIEVTVTPIPGGAAAVVGGSF